MTNREISTNSQFTQLDGHPLDPLSTDLFAQQIDLVMGVVPPGEGWRILTGNERMNRWARVAYRFEIEE